MKLFQASTKQYVGFLLRRDYNLSVNPYHAAETTPLVRSERSSGPEKNLEGYLSCTPCRRVDLEEDRLVVAGSVILSDTNRRSDR